MQETFFCFSDSRLCSLYPSRPVPFILRWFGRTVKDASPFGRFPFHTLICRDRELFLPPSFHIGNQLRPLCRTPSHGRRSPLNHSPSLTLSSLHSPVTSTTTTSKFKQALIVRSSVRPFQLPLPHRTGKRCHRLSAGDIQVMDNINRVVLVMCSFPVIEHRTFVIEVEAKHVQSTILREELMDSSYEEFIQTVWERVNPHIDDEGLVPPISLMTRRDDGKYMSLKLDANRYGLWLAIPQNWEAARLMLDLVAFHVKVEQQHDERDIGETVVKTYHIVYDSDTDLDNDNNNDEENDVGLEDSDDGHEDDGGGAWDDGAREEAGSDDEDPEGSTNDDSEGSTNDDSEEAGSTNDDSEDNDNKEAVGTMRAVNNEEDDGAGEEAGSDDDETEDSDDDDETEDSDDNDNKEAVGTMRAVNNEEDDGAGEEAGSDDDETEDSDDDDETEDSDDDDDGMEGSDDGNM